MKNKLTLLLLLCFCMAAYSQDEDVLRPKGRPASDGSQTNNRQSKSKSSKNPWSYGVEVGLNLNMYSQSMSGLHPDSRFAVFESGSGFSPFIGVYLDYALSDNTGIQFKLAVDQKKFGNTKSGIIDAQRELSTEVIAASVNSEYTNTAEFITITPQFRWNITQDFFLLAGPSIHIKSGKARQEFSETLISPSDVYYNGYFPEKPTKIVVNTDDFLITDTRVGLQFDLGYQYKVSPKMTFVPKIGFQYMFTNFNDDETFTENSRPLTLGNVIGTATNKALHSLQLSIGIWYNF